MHDCRKCKKYPTCTKLCSRVEKKLPRDTTGRLPNEISMDPQKMDQVFSKQ